MTAGAGISTVPDPVEAAEAACREALTEAGEGPVDLAFVFFSNEHSGAAVEMVEVAQKVLAPHALLGGSAQAVLAGSREIERSPAVSVWAARTPATAVTTFGAVFDRETGAVLGFPAEIPTGATAIMIVDPYTFPADDFLRLLNDERPELAIVGGMASGAPGPGGSRLVLDREVRNGGAVGAIVSGRIKIRPLVSQGCRPIGSPATVTRAERNVIFELAGQPPLKRIRDTYMAADAEGQLLMQQGLHVGRVVDEYKSEFTRGDFLIRSVMGTDPETGAIAVGDRVDIGETIQFHVRDATSADEDLRELVASVEPRPAAALLFTCNGRGTHMFDVPDHDVTTIQRGFGGIPLAGFFCAGELGPIGGKNFVHGFTASIALFTEG